MLEVLGRDSAVTRAQQDGPADLGRLDVLAVDAAAAAAQLNDFKVVTYDRPVTLMNALLGIDLRQGNAGSDWSRVGAAATPRLWYLAPNCDLAAILSMAGANP